MNPSISKAWIEALRSGDYKQTQGCLHSADGYCCLGVLTDLYIKEHGGKWNDPLNGGRAYSFHGHFGTLPTAVRDWAEIRISMPGIFGVPLAEMNDSGLSFQKIAEHMEDAEPINIQ